jgi:hypothetical protein
MMRVHVRVNVCVCVPARVYLRVCAVMFALHDCVYAHCKYVALSMRVQND